MKKLIFVAGLVLAVFGIAIAGDSLVFTVSNQVAATNSVTAPKANGFLEAIVIDVTGTTTQTLTFTSARTGEAVLTVTTSADTVEILQVVLQGVTGVDTNVLSKFFCINDAFTVTCAETAGVTNTTTITVITSDDK